MSGLTPQQRAGDRAWLRENFEVLRDAARRGYQQSGRGAIVVQATLQPVPGKGNPTYWLTAAQQAQCLILTDDRAHGVPIRA
jgi:hypothetical protein